MNIVPSVLRDRFRELTVVFFVLSALVAVVGVSRSFSGSVAFSFFVWVCGVSASLFGVAFTVMALVAFLYSEDDQVDIRCALGVLVLAVGSATAIGWSGLASLGLLAVGWSTGRAGRRSQDQEWRAANRDRRAFFARVRRSDARLDPEAGRFLEISTPSLGDREVERQRSEARRDHPDSRGAAIDRARTIDGNPWNLPPDQR